MDPCEEVIIEPRKGRGEELVPPGVVICFTPPDLKMVASSLGVSRAPKRKLDFWLLRQCPPPLDKVGVVGAAFGAPAAVTLLERLIVLGAKAVIGLGSCGSLQAEVPIGSVVIPEGSVIEEGTSAHYLAAGVRTSPHPQLMELVCGALEEEGVVPVRGKVWTTDAVFRETKLKVKKLAAQGVLAVDMESSALMTVANFRGIALVSVLVVSDELWTLKWRKGFKEKRFVDALAAGARASAKSLQRWCQGNSIRRF